MGDKVDLQRIDQPAEMSAWAEGVTRVSTEKAQLSGFRPVAPVHCPLKSLECGINLFGANGPFVSLPESCCEKLGKFVGASVHLQNVPLDVPELIVCERVVFCCAQNVLAAGHSGITARRVPYGVFSFVQTIRHGH